MIQFSENLMMQVWHGGRDNGGFSKSPALPKEERSWNTPMLSMIKEIGMTFIELEHARKVSLSQTQVSFPML